MNKPIFTLRLALSIVAFGAILLLAILFGSTQLPMPTTQIASPTPLQTRRTGQLEIHLLDVKHGDAQLIVSPTGETILIDGGRAEFAEKTANYIKSVLGQTTVDYFLATHYHTDHIGGVVSLFRDQGLKVRKAIYDRGGTRAEFTEETAYPKYYDYVTNPQNNLNRVRIRVGDTIDLGPQLNVRVLSVGDIDTRTALNIPVVGENDNSVVLWLTFGKFDYWTGGDLSGEASIRYADIETAIIPLLPRQADAYKANHHCVNYNNNLAFLTALKPTVSLISGSNAVIGWKCVLRLEAQSEVYITDQIPVHQAAGDIVLTSRDGNTFEVAGKTYQSK